MSDSKCGCCHREGTKHNPIIGIASSSVAPMSIAWCAECLNQYAEPAWLMLAVCDPEEEGKLDKAAFDKSFLIRKVYNTATEKYQPFGEWYDWFFAMEPGQRAAYQKLENSKNKS